MLVMENETTYLRRSIAMNILRLFFEDTIEEKLDALPVQMVPRDEESKRCCIYKDRAIIRYRIMALLGLSIEEDDDETLLLRDLYRKALQRENITGPVLTVIDAACSSCLSSQYLVTDLCRGCVARPCENNCPKNAITIEKGKSVIDAKLCVNCGKCQQVCPYNAIIYTPIPCEEKCPVSAIHKNGGNREEIHYDACIYCGKCTRNCPFGAIMERSQIIDVAKHIKNGSKVVAMVAPSIIGQLPGTPGQLFNAIKKIGFTHVIEVAEGAEITAKKEAEELKERLAAGNRVMGTSCCPAYTEAVKKHVPEFQASVSHTKSPMSYTAEAVAEQYPDSVRVFIGPCIAKKHEGIHDPHVDYVLTYEELGAFMVARDIFVLECEEEAINSEHVTSFGRGFAVSQGVTTAVQHYYGEEPINAYQIDGLSKKGIKQLELVAKGNIKAQLVEVMSCEGGCLYGPGIISNPKISRKTFESYLKKQPE